ncbi:MAG: phosphopantetheine-binding [Paenibacillaceae bacterium]|jgi:acyl carrier protein|nr:phosphopantetheine-binding [Paenibacillaceae bacterium]
MPLQHQDKEWVIRETAGVIARITRRDPSAIQQGHSLGNDLDIDSLQLLELIAQLEETFGFEVEPEELEPEHFRSVQAVTHYVERKLRI